MRTPVLSPPPAGTRLSRRKLLLAGLAIPPAVVAALLLGALLYRVPLPPPPPPAPAAADQAALPPPGGLLVEVTGAVEHPGVYRVAKGERVSVAILAAGGVTADADPDRLPNMAARLQDGQQIRVPSRRGSPGSGSGTGSTRAAAVDLNVATEEQLAAVPGFTQALAAAVIRYRQEYGGFASTRELVDVLEMGEADYVLARRYLTV